MGYAQAMRKIGGFIVIGALVMALGASSAPAVAAETAAPSFITEGQAQMIAEVRPWITGDYSDLELVAMSYRACLALQWTSPEDYADSLVVDKSSDEIDKLVITAGAIAHLCG